MLARLGVATTPAKWVSSDSRLEACVSRRERVVRLQLVFQLLHAHFGQWLHHHQGVYEQAVAQGGGHAPGGGVRAGDQAHRFQIGHDVADGGRADFQAGKLLQGARPYRLAVADVAFHQGLEQDLCAVVEHGAHSTITAELEIKGMLQAQYCW